MPTTKPKQIDTSLALSMRKQIELVFAAGTIEDKKALLRECVETMILHPEEMRVEVRYNIPGIPLQMQMNPSTFGAGVHISNSGSGGGKPCVREH